MASVQHLAEEDAGFSIRVVRHFTNLKYPPPVAVDGFTLKVAWHSRQNLDRAVQYVCGIVRETFETASTQPTLLLEG